MILLISICFVFINCKKIDILKNQENLIDIQSAQQSINPKGITTLVLPNPSKFCQDQIRNSIAIPSDGTQQKTVVTCSSLALGVLPVVQKMSSTLIIQPANNAQLDAQVENSVKVSTRNLVSGFFSNATKFYYVAPQTLDNGNTQGHLHITIQSMNGQTVLDPTKFDFFKGINNPAPDKAAIAGNNRDTLEAIIPANTIRVNGLYRICSMTGSFSHQPQLSPVLQRGPIEDCIRVQFNNALG